MISIYYTCFAFYCISAVLRDRCRFCCSVLTSTIINEHYYYYYYYYFNETLYKIIVFSGHCLKDFQSQRSKVKVMNKWNAIVLEDWRYALQWCGIKAHSLKDIWLLTIFHIATHFLMLADNITYLWKSRKQLHNWFIRMTAHLALESIIYSSSIITHHDCLLVH